MRVDRGGEPAQQRGPVPGATARQARCAATARAIAASVSCEVAWPRRDRLLGGRVQHRERGHAAASRLRIAGRRARERQQRSKPRRSSQSVTAASKAASSTRA